MRVEMGIAYDDETWGTVTVEIPDETPEDKIEAVAREAVDSEGTTGVGTWLHHYSADGDEESEEDEERLDRFCADLERRQEDGEPLICASCDADIQPGETADPCFICGQPLCHFCSISGPRCRGCADLP